MEEEKSLTEEQSSVHRGVLHVWSGPCSESLAPERVLLPMPVLQVSLGACHGLLLAEGGLVFSVGELPWRTGLVVPLSQPQLEHSLKGRTVVSVSAGSFHCGALTEEGAVYMWGENSAGQCGAQGMGTPDGDGGGGEGGGRRELGVGEGGGSSGYGLNPPPDGDLSFFGSVCGPKRAAPLLVSEPQLLCLVDKEHMPPAMVRVRALACGGEHTLALSAQREVWSWGSGCQLGLVTTTTFPVWRPQKVEHLSGRYVIQVACGSYHSLALVRSQSPKDYTTQSSSSSSDIKRGQCQKPLCSMMEQDDGIIMNNIHYCPLGVELAQRGAYPVQSSPVRRAGAKLRPRHTSPEPCSVPHPSRDLAGMALMDPVPSCADTGLKPDRQDVDCGLNQSEPAVYNQPSSANQDQAEYNRQDNGPITCRKDCNASPKASRGTSKSSAFPGELEFQDYLQRESDESFDEQAVNHISKEGDVQSLASQNSDESFEYSLYDHLGDSSPLLNSSPASSCPDDHTHSYRRTLAERGASPSVCIGSAPVGLESVRVRLEESMLGKKSCSLTNILEEQTAAANRRRSLPGQLSSHAGGSPVPPRSVTSRTSRGLALLQEPGGDSVPSLDNEVWSWGRGQEGQLGHGDRLPRLQPLCIKSLTGKEVVRLAAGTHHSLAITAQCQAFSWGSNISGQLGRINSPITQPQQVKMEEGVRVWGVSGGLSHSLFLVDGDRLKPALWHCGPKFTQGPRSEVNHAQGSANKKDAFRADVLPLSVELGYISRVCSGGQGWASLSDHNIMGFISAVHDLAANERRVYCWVSDVRKKVLRPLLNKASVTSLLGKTCSTLFQTLAERFKHLSLLIGQHSVSLTNFLRRTQHRDVTSLLLLTHTSLFLETYKEYCSSIGNFQVMGGFQNLHKLSLECFGKKQEVLLSLSECGSPEDLLLRLFHQPLRALHHYSTQLLRLATCYDVSTREYQLLQQGFAQYEALSLGLSRRKKEAEATWLFWKTSSGKSVESLRCPERRLVCESSNRTLTLQNAGRFSNVWFLLFNDALVQAQGTIPSKSFLSSYQAYPLATLWVKPVTEDDSGLHAIKVTCPEESFTLIASTAQEKAKWLRALNQEVEAVQGGGHGSGVPAVTRSATYTFQGEGRLKDVRYCGVWVAGKPHGRGTMRWPDGRMYEGTFRNGLEDGNGTCVIPTKVLNQPDRYSGKWREAKIHGFGVYRYASGEVYEGFFHEGQRHGYGILRSGRLGKSSSSVFIGQWVQDKKTGYGVFDDITKGEKYMGTWLEDQKQGSAVVVTQFGLYYEGAFSSNKMTGVGLLVSDDDTSFQGEFSDDWTVNGKGTLTLSNRDLIEGQFSGQWSSGLKIAGTYTKPRQVEETERRPRANTLEVGVLAVQAQHKWRCVFEECWSRLGCDTPGQGDRRRAWESIAVTLTAGRRDSPKLSRSQRKVLERLEFIPREEGPMTVSSYNELRRYLATACESRLHPLGWLLETLVTVYRMTYVGVGCNRRLLHQAVQEIHSYLTRIFSILRFLFPELPEEGGFVPETQSTSDLSSDDGSSGTQQDSSHHGYVVSSSTLLLPVLLPPLYPPLFTLYVQDKEKEERLYWDCVQRLNKQTDHALLSFLGVHRKFWPVTVSALGVVKQVESTSRDLCYSSSVETLQQISTTFTPSDKLRVIQRTFRELSQEVQAAMEGMDDLLPPFLYVVIRARIGNLGAEVSLIEDLMDSSVQLGELGFLFTTLKGSYYQIQQETA